MQTNRRQWGDFPQMPTSCGLEFALQVLGDTGTIPQWPCPASGTSTLIIIIPAASVPVLPGAGLRAVCLLYASLKQQPGERGARPSVQHTLTLSRCALHVQVSLLSSYTQGT